VAGNGGIDDFAAVRLAGREGTDLVYSHEAAVTCDISRERRRQSPIDTLSRHDEPPVCLTRRAYQTMAAGALP
jgi:hypothetical protein